MGPAARAREHARAARLLAEEAESPERVAAQLLRCPPAGDPWAFERLVAAARAGRARAAPPTRSRRTCCARWTSRRRRSGAPRSCSTLGARRVPVRPGRGGRAPARGARRARSRSSGASRRRCCWPACSATSGRVGEAADVVEEQFDALAARPDLRGPTEAALANITRIDPATRRRADAVIERMRRARRRRRARSRRCSARSPPRWGWPASPPSRMAELAETRRRSGMEPTADHRRRLVLVQRRRARWSSASATTSRCGRSTTRWSGRASAARRSTSAACSTFRAELFVHIGRPRQRRGRRAHAARDRRSATAGCSGSGRRRGCSARC